MASKLQHTLPPRTGGVFAALDTASSNGMPLDVVFMAHAGFERLGSLRALWNGDAVGTKVRIVIWREPADAVPVHIDDRKRWLYRNWMKMDALVGDPSTDAYDRSR